MSDFGIYKGREFLELQLPERVWLVEGLIREKDSVMFVGNEKSGKSLFIFQLICSLTSQHPFIDKYEIPKPIRVSYVQLEGELADSQNRFKRMIKSLDINADLFQMLYLPPQDIQARAGAFGLRDNLAKHNPDVVIIDPIYFAFSGSLSDDFIVRQFIGHLRIIKDTLQCAIILVHHTHKIRWNQKGEIIAEGDEAAFGSKFLKAWPDHTLLFVYNKKDGKRILSCETQRSGDIETRLILKLNEPDPLYFEEMTDKPNLSSHLLELFKCHPSGLIPQQVMDRLHWSRNLFYKSLKPLLNKNLVIKDESHRPVIYKIKSGG